MTAARPGETVMVRIASVTLQCEAVREADCEGPNCGERILWTRTPAGKWMPIDLPIPDDAPGTPHWATCPDRESFRK